jgi:hypothetical protein
MSWSLMTDARRSFGLACAKTAGAVLRAATAALAAMTERRVMDGLMMFLPCRFSFATCFAAMMY